MGEFALGTDGIRGETRVGERLERNRETHRIRGAIPSDLEAIGALVRRSMAHPWTLDQLASALASPGSRVQMVLGESPGARDASPIAFARDLGALLEGPQPARERPLD